MNQRFKDEVAKVVQRVCACYGAAGVIEAFAPVVEEATRDIREHGLEVPGFSVEQGHPADDDRDAVIAQLRASLAQTTARCEELGSRLEMSEKTLAEVRSERNAMMATFGFALVDADRISKATNIEAATKLARAILGRFTPTQRAMLDTARKAAEQPATLPEVAGNA